MGIDLKVRRQDYPTALASLENLVTDLDQHQADISQQLTVMILKARIYDMAGIPQKGFSVALRAASLAHKARLIPLLCEAVSAVCKVLVSIKEFEAATSLLESVMPYVLECEDCVLTAYVFSCLADSHMGMAGKPNAATLHRKEQLNKALEAISRSFDEYAKIGDIQGQCEMMAKKATIMHLNGDPVLANDCAAKYLDIRTSDKDSS